MFKSFLILIPVILTLLTSGCSTNRFSAHRQIESFGLIETTHLEESYAKAVCDQQARTVFLMNKARQEIDIYRKSAQINRIGGLGFERTNFQRLSDIGVDTDGGLLALDSSQRLLRKFSPEGEVVADFTLETLRQPELFCVGTDGNIFVFDAASAEIVCFSGLDSAELYRFGRFELEQPVVLACNHDYLYAYSASLNKTTVFYLLGQYKETLDGQMIYDAFNNPITADELMSMYGSQTPLLLSIQADIVTMLSDSELRLFRIRYQGDNLETP